MDQLEEDIRYLHKLKNRLSATEEDNPNQRKIDAIASAYSIISISIRNLEKLKLILQEEL
jgi:hypothetical protein